MVVTKRVSDTSVWINLNSPKYTGLKPRIMSIIQKNYINNTKEIKICDIQMEDNNIGNGYIAMKYFIKVSKEMRFNKIVGDISNVDKDHWDRLIHYYKKFGFKVIFNKEYTLGKIELNFLSQE